MAMTGLLNSNKFKYLTRLTQLPRVYVLGHLEMMWLTAHESNTPHMGNAELVETACEWAGEEGLMADALLKSGFVDAVDGGGFEVHDYFEHAPDYIKKRVRRHQSTQSLDLRGKTADNGGQRRTTADNGGQRQPMSAYPTQPNPTQPNTTEQKKENNQEIERENIGDPVITGRAD